MHNVTKYKGKKKRECSWRYSSDACCFPSFFFKQDYLPLSYFNALALFTLTL